MTLDVPTVVQAMLGGHLYDPVSSLFQDQEQSLDVWGAKDWWVGGQTETGMEPDPSKIASQSLAPEPTITQPPAHHTPEPTVSPGLPQAVHGLAEPGLHVQTPLGNPFSVVPVPGGKFTDSFGAPRYAGGYHTHEGIDIMAPKGTPIYAPIDGVFTRDNNTLGGNAFRLSGSGGYIYGAHLSRFAKGVKDGQRVKAGTVIGFVGNTGDARGGPTHLHFEWHPGGGDAIDPYQYLHQTYTGAKGQSPMPTEPQPPVPSEKRAQERGLSAAPVSAAPVALSKGHPTRFSSVLGSLLAPEIQASVTKPIATAPPSAPAGSKGWIKSELYRGFIDAGRPDLAKMVFTKAFETWINAESGWNPGNVSGAYSGKVNGGLFQFRWFDDRKWLTPYFRYGNTPGSNGRNTFTASAYQQALFVARHFSLTPDDIRTYAEQIRSGTYGGWG